MVIGGAEIYAQAMRFATRLEITQIHLAPEGDTHFPTIEPAVWREASRTAHPAGPNDDAPYDFVSYLKMNSVQTHS
jgi:dihydrofolate reductase